MARVFFSRMQVRASRSAPAFRLRVADAVRGHGPKAEAVGQVEQRLMGGLLLAPSMALYINEDALRPEGGHEARQAIGVGGPAQGLDPGQGDETVYGRLSGTLPKPFEPDPAFPLRYPRFHPGDQAAQGLVALPVLDQKGQSPSTFQAQLGSHEGPDPRRPRRLVEARCSRHAVTVHEGEGGIAELGRPRHEVLGEGRPAQEGEGGGGVELGVHRLHSISLFLRSPAIGPIPLPCLDTYI